MSHILIIPIPLVPLSPFPDSPFYYIPIPFNFCLFFQLNPTHFFNPLSFVLNSSSYLTSLSCSLDPLTAINHAFFLNRLYLLILYE